MGFIRKSKSRSFDLLSSYNHYTPGWKGLGMVLVMFLLGMVLSGIATVIMTVLAASKLIPTDFPYSYGTVISYPLMFIPLMMYARSKSSFNRFFETGYAIDNNHFEPLGGLKAALLCTALMLGLIFATDPISMLLPPMSPSIKQALEMMMNGPLWVSVLSVCIFAPIFEEWLCRGIVLRSLLRLVKPVWAIVISAAFFALIHGNLWQGINAFLIGCAMGFVYYRTGSLKLTMLIHFVNNTFSTVLSRVTNADVDTTTLDMLGGNITVYVLIVLAGAVVSAASIWMLLRVKPLSSKGSCMELQPEEYSGK